VLTHGGIFSVASRCMSRRVCWPFLQALLGKLDTLLVLQQAAAPHASAGDAAAEAAAGSAGTPHDVATVQSVSQSPADDRQATGSPPPAAAELEMEEQVEVSLQAGGDGQVAFKLTLSPSKAAAPASAEPRLQEADPGHMPTSPLGAGGPGGRPHTGRRSESTASSRPGALHDGAARGEAALLAA
jgi:hypothetical protein